MGTRRTAYGAWGWAAVAVLPAVAAGCSSGATDPEPAPTPPVAAGVPPDTGALGLTPVEGAPLFVLLDPEAVPDTAARRRLDEIRARPTSAAVRVARLAAGADTLLTAGRAVAFDVNPRRRLVFAGTGRNDNANGTTSWFGELRGGRFGQANLVYSTATGAPHVVGVLRVGPPDGAIYAVEPLGGVHHAITYIDYTKYPPGEG